MSDLHVSDHEPGGLEVLPELVDAPEGSGDPQDHAAGGDESPVEEDEPTVSMGASEQAAGQAAGPHDADVFASREALDSAMPIDPTHELPTWVREAMQAPPADPSNEAAYARFIQRMFMDALRMRMNMAQDARIAEAIKLAREVSEEGIAAEARGYDPTA